MAIIQDSLMRRILTILALTLVYFILEVAVCSGQTCSGGNCTAASVSTTDVQNCITSTTAGHTCTIPAGSAAWTSGVTISGKGITVQGAGAGRIIAYSSSTIASIATGSQTWTGVTSTLVSGSLTITNGETLRISETGNRQNFMQGTVTSYSSGTLVMNISSTGGSCGNSSSGTSPSNCKRWLISTIPQTVITNNSSTTLFSVTEDTSVDTNLSGFKIAAGTGAGDGVDFIPFNTPSTGTPDAGLAIVLQNCWIEQNATSGDSVHTATNKGVISNCSFDSTPFSMAPLAIHLQPYDETAWANTSFFGTLDTTGQHNFYVETSDFEAYLNLADNDEAARSVFRYSTYDNAGFGTHGADTGPLGQRYFEYYQNIGVFNGYNDGTTFPMNWWIFVRGGTFVVHDNTLPALVSTDYGTKSDVNFIIENLARNAGPNPCWGVGTSGGAFYFAPRQPGFGHVTGTGIAGNGSGTYSAAAYGYSPTEYVGDREPAYIWGNTRVPLGNIGINDFSPNQCSGTPDTTSNYVQLNRDYFNSSTAKPSYTPYTYPHPLVSGGLAWSVTATNGTITGSNCASGSYSNGTIIGPCTASPNTGFSFTGWSGVSGSATCSGTTNPCPSFTITSNSAVTANFSGNESLTVSNAGSGSGSITGTNCVTGTYPSATTIGTCTASASTGSTFSSWSGTGSASGCTGSGTCGPFSLVATSTLIATFVLNSYTISTATSGTGSGSITGCAGAHNFGSSYTCTVVPSSGSVLSSVSGCGGSGTTSYSGTMPASNCTVTANFSLIASAPTFSPPAGSYGPAQTVTISTTTTGSTICYTTDGSTPTANGAGTCVHGSTYSAPITVSSSETVRAIASLSGFSDSGVSSAAYIINGAVATPTFSPVAGSYSSPQRVGISTSTSGASCFFTVDGSTPTTSSPAFNHKLYIAKSQTIKAICSKSAFSNSTVGSAAYTISTAKTRFSLSRTGTSQTPNPFPPDDRACCGTTVTDVESIRGAYVWTTVNTWMSQAQTNSSTFDYTIQKLPTWMTGQATPGGYPPTDLSTSGTCQAPIAGIITTDCSMKEFTTALVQNVTGLTSQPVNPVTCTGLDYIEPINEFNTDTSSGTQSAGWTGTYAQLATLANDISTIVHNYCSNTVVLIGSASAIVGSHSNGADAHFDGALETVAADWAGLASPSLPDGISFHAYSARGTVSPVPFPTSLVSASSSACTSGNTPNTSCYVAIKDQINTINSSSVLQNSAIKAWANNLPILSTEGGFGTLSQLCSLTNGPTLCTDWVSEYMLLVAQQNPVNDLLYAAFDTTWGDYQGSPNTAWYTAFNQTSSWLTSATLTGSPTSTPVSGGNVWTIPCTNVAGSCQFAWFDGNFPATTTQGTSFATQQTLAGATLPTGGSVTLSQAPVFLTSTPAVATPTFSPVSGTYISTQSVTISSTTGGAVICYTTDGSTPTTNGAGTCTHGTTYSAPVTVASSLTINAIATESGFTDSIIASAAYTITGTVSTPTFAPVGGTYFTPQIVTLSSSTSGAVICYTTDGSTPTATSGVCTHGTTYSAPISVATSQTVKSLGTESGWANSSVSSASYVITIVAPTNLKGTITISGGVTIQ